jgi:hypothetical protein
VNICMCACSFMHACMHACMCGCVCVCMRVRRSFMSECSLLVGEESVLSYKRMLLPNCKRHHNYPSLRQDLLLVRLGLAQTILKKIRRVFDTLYIWYGFWKIPTMSPSIWP